MKLFIRRWIFSALFTSVLAASTLAYALPKNARVPGGIALVPLGSVSTEPPGAWLGDQPVWVTAMEGQWIAVVGLALNTPEGVHKLRVSDGLQLREVHFEVSKKDYPEQRIRLKDTSKVILSSADEARAIDEIARIQKLKRHWRETGPVDVTAAGFLTPAAGRLSSRFGLRPIFNGEPRAPHTGLDVAAPRGTPVRAGAQGEVLAVDNYFFNGKTIFVDHGNGLISMYCHLDRIDVHPGDSVSRGQHLGLSGMTGRASGPHLHWSVILNGAMVDPSLFLHAGKVGD